MTAPGELPDRSDDEARTWRMRAAAAGFLVSAVGPLPAFLIGAQAVQMKADLGFDDRGLGLALTVFFAVAGVSATRSGRFADRIGWRRAVLTTAGGALVSAAALGLLTPTYAALLAALVLAGVVFSIAIPTGNVVLAVVLPRDRFATAFGLKSATIGVGGMLAGLSVPALALTVGWRWSFATGAVIAVVAALVAPRDLPFTERVAPEAPTPAGKGPLLLLTVAGGFATVTVGALSAFLVVSSVSAGLRPAAAGLLLSTATAVGITVVIVSGVLADRYGSPGLRPVAVMLAVAVAGYLLLAAGSPALVVAGAFLAFGAGWGWPGLFHYGVVLHFSDRPGSASGVVQAGLSTGMAVGPLTFGSVAGQLGYQTVWSTVAVVAALAAGLVLVAWRRLPDPDTVADLTTSASAVVEG